jgi:alkaline phosphatase
MSSGMKTHNRVIGLDENKNPIPNILEEIKFIMTLRLM